MKNWSKMVAVVFGLTLVGASGCVAEAGDGTEDEPLAESAEAIVWMGHLYTFNTYPAPYYQARNQCLANNLQLVVVNSGQEEDWLNEQQKNKGSGGWWIGLTDANEGVWVWDDSSPYGGYSNFSPGEPNNAGDEDCVEDYGPYLASGRWNDVGCGNTRKYICEGPL